MEHLHSHFPGKKVNKPAGEYPNSTPTQFLATEFESESYRHTLALFPWSSNLHEKEHAMLFYTAFMPEWTNSIYRGRYQRKDGRSESLSPFAHAYNTGTKVMWLASQDCSWLLAFLDPHCFPHGHNSSSPFEIPENNPRQGKSLFSKQLFMNTTPAFPPTLGRTEIPSREHVGTKESLCF